MSNGNKTYAVQILADGSQAWFLDGKRVDNDISFLAKVNFQLVIDDYFLGKIDEKTMQEGYKKNYMIVSIHPS